MSYIDFNKTQLINLQFSLERELLRTNMAGSYASSSIIFTNTRKYHGLLVVPQPLIDDNNHVLLSTVDETIIENNFEFHLSMRMYPHGNHDPKGHKYLREFSSDPNPKLVYRFGSNVLTKETIFAQNDARFLMRYTMTEAAEKVILRIKPFLAFRSVHDYAKANVYADNKHINTLKGAAWQMYKGYSKVFMQFSKDVNYIHIPDWYYNIIYIREIERGYSGTEDLYVPGYFEVEMKKGESVVISAGLEEKNPATFKKQFESEIKKRTPRKSYEHCLENAANEFFVKINKKTEIIAGYPWFGRWGRDTFIALPGLTLTGKDEKTFKAVVKTMLDELKDGLFPNTGLGKNIIFNSVDTSLWFFWALQQYCIITGKKEGIWEEYGRKMKAILNQFAKGTHFNIKMHENGLIWAGEQGKAITWMDAIVHGKPVTPRVGYAVEVNALWYNAIKFSLELAELAKDSNFIKTWKRWPAVIEKSFREKFWDVDRGYLADCATNADQDWTVRPNMIFAVSMPYSPVELSIQRAVVGMVKQQLLTNRGLRSLSPKDKDYKGVYYGNQAERDLAYHQGSVWTWLLGAFAEAYLRVNGEGGKEFIREIFNGFEEVMTEAGIGTISEVYNGDPPHQAGGAISQAWSVAELLRIKWMLESKK
jgi:predicted glycogen debranching enzyme